MAPVKTTALGWEVGRDDRGVQREVT